jgi:hypothetical protein
MSGTTVHIAETGGRALYLAPRLQYSAYLIVDISPIAAQIRSVEYWSLHMRNCNCIVYLGTTVHIALTGGRVLYWAPSLQYNAHWIDEISPIAAQTSSLENCSLNIHNCNYIVYVLDHSSHSVNWRMSSYFAPRLQYSAHWIVEISPIAGQIRAVEYRRLNMRKCKYLVYGREHCSHSVNWSMCAVFGTKFAV